MPPSSIKRRVGYVHFSGALGEQIRIEAVRRALREAEVEVTDFKLPLAASGTGEATVSAAVVGDIGRKLLLKAPVSVLKEKGWRAEAERWERSAEEGAALMANGLSSVDVLHAETLFAGLACLRVHERTRLPFVLDMHGVMREEAKLVGSPTWEAWCARWEARVVAAAERVIAVSPLMADYLASAYGVSRDHVVVAPNGSYLSDRHAAFQSPLTVLYAGNFAPFENVMEVVRTGELAAGRFELWLVGDGALRTEVFDYVNGHGIDMLYWGRRSRARTIELFLRAQVGFAGQSGARDLVLDHPRQLGCPIKLFDYAACGLPVVAPPGEWAPLLYAADCGVIAKDATAPAFLEALDALDDQSVWERKARNARELIANGHQWSQVLAPIVALYQ